MISLKKNLRLLCLELSRNLVALKSVNGEMQYYNENLGDTSFLLAGLLNTLLKKNSSKWDNDTWIDDSLITNKLIENNKLKIFGVMIFGKLDTTDQWTYPFYFETVVLNNKMRLNTYVFLFGDSEKKEIPYELFKKDQKYWMGNNRIWKYVLNSVE